MLKTEIPDIQDALVGEIAERADWVIANIDTSICWPVTCSAHEFCGRTYYVIPLTKDHYPAVAIKRGTETIQEARSSILRFLSAVSWVESAGAIVASFSAGGLPRPMGREKSFGHCIGDLHLAYLPEAITDSQRLALALMREGRGLNHPAYAFLSFYRVLEAALPVGLQRGQWVTDNIDAISNHRGKEALAQLRASGIEDVGAHLYKSGRMAIAHAGGAAGQPIISPDDASDHDRIAGELPIMSGLAELAIERVLGIKTRHTVYREHLYELAGFKEVLGATKVADIDAGRLPKEGELIDLPLIDVELRGKEPYQPLRSMRPVGVHQEGRVLHLLYSSENELVQFALGLDFAEEKIRFEWATDIGGRDDGSVDAALYGAAITRFILEYIGNGELYIYDSETRKLLSRVSSFIPVNYWANDKALKRQIEEWTAEAVRRTEQSADAPADGTSNAPTGQ